MNVIESDVATAMVREALEARARAHAPYSEFRSGAAVLTSDGTIVAGAIVENISLGLAMCAERVAMFAAATAGGDRPRLQALVLAAPDTGPQLTWPCGACRQVALELGGTDLVVAAVGEGADPETPVEWRSIRELLPDAPRSHR